MWLTRSIESAIETAGENIAEAVNVGNAIRLERIEHKLSEVFLAITHLKGSVMSHLERLTESVRAVNTKADSLITLTKGLAEKIRELSTDEAALNALADELDAQGAELQAAIDENTVPAPPTE